MGTKLWKEAVFIRDLKASLRERGVQVKKKDLINFFILWFIIDGAEIHRNKWRRVGRELNEILARAPMLFLQMFSLIGDSFVIE